MDTKQNFTVLELPLARMPTSMIAGRRNEKKKRETTTFISKAQKTERVVPEIVWSIPFHRERVMKENHPLTVIACTASTEVDSYTCYKKLYQHISSSSSDRKVDMSMEGIPANRGTQFI